MDNLISDSVRLRMVSDFPVGVFLSGGYDSSLVTSYMCEHSKKKIETFTVGFEDKLINESIYAKKIAKYLGTNHNEFILSTKDVTNIISYYKNLFDEPIGDPAILPTAYLAKQTKKKVKVVQSADGGDELFAGYDKYRKILHRNKKSKKIPLWLKKLFNKNSVKNYLNTNKLIKKNYKYFTNNNLIDWFIDESIALNDIDLKRLLLNYKRSK